MFLFAYFGIVWADVRKCSCWFLSLFFFLNFRECSWNLFWSWFSLGTSSPMHNLFARTIKFRTESLHSFSSAQMLCHAFES